MMGLVMRYLLGWGWEQACGRDGTALFTSQHGGQGGPAAILAQFQIGTLR